MELLGIFNCLLAIKDMKRYFNISLAANRKYSLGISGYSKIYNWFFAHIVKVKQSILSTSPTIITRIQFLHISKVNANISSPTFIIRLIAENVIKPIQKLSHNTFYEKLKFNIFHDAQLLCNIDRLGLKIYIGGLLTASVKLKQLAVLSMAQFYRLKEWDYKNPSDTSFRYYLREIDHLTLDEMDIKFRIE